MKHRHRSLIVALTLGLFACNTEIKTQTDDSERDSIVDTTLSMSAEELAMLCVECTRGQAVPVIKKEVYPNTRFALESDRISGIETVGFDNGDKLTIRNYGCEYVTLTFRFETTKYQHDTTDLSFWFSAANNLVKDILKGLDEPVGVKDGTVALGRYISRSEKDKAQSCKLGEEIDFGDSDMRSFVTVDRIEQIDEQKFAVTISFSRGPL